jgi:hypothetical protein
MEPTPEQYEAARLYIQNYLDKSVDKLYREYTIYKMIFEYAYDNKLLAGDSAPYIPRWMKKIAHEVIEDRSVLYIGSEA